MLKPPPQLPQRPRKKLLTCLHKFAPTPPLPPHPEPQTPYRGPPAYIKEAFPHSRLTLFCGESRAPRWGKRVEAARPTSSLNGYPSSPLAQPNGYTNGTTREANGMEGIKVAHSRHASTQSVHQVHPLSYSKVAGGIARSVSENHLAEESDMKEKVSSWTSLSRVLAKKISRLKSLVTCWMIPGYACQVRVYARVFTSQSNCK